MKQMRGNIVGSEQGLARTMSETPRQEEKLQRQNNLLEITSIFADLPATSKHTV